MREALAEAETAAAEGEVPIGAVAVLDGRVVSRGHNRRRALSDITAHAEVMCLRGVWELAEGDFDLSRLCIYSTLEPCAMCTGAIVHYRIGRVVFGETDVMLGACGGAMDTARHAGLSVTGGVLREECRRLLLEFFERENGRPSARWADIELPTE
jgi:tRNA(adenine34) deaminase